MHTVVIKMIHPLPLPNTFSLIDKKQLRIEDTHYSAIMEVIVLAQHLYIFLRSHLPQSEFYFIS